MTFTDWLLGRPVYHRQPKKNRRDALRPCSGLAFRTRRTDGVPVNEIPKTCATCGQPIQPRYLDFSFAVTAPVRVPSRDLAAPRTVVLRVAPRHPRHFGPKGAPVTEVEP